MRNLLTLFALSVLLLAGACKKGFEGERNPLSPPETFMAIDTIFRTGENRLTTTVTANWWATSKGGFIKGYEVSVDNGSSWKYTTAQDSTFLLDIPPGKDTADVIILVRAIDNLGQSDPTPASSLFPVKNSAPTVSFVFSQVIAGIPSSNPTNVFPVLRYSITGIDPDGETLQNYELFINDTNSTPYILPGSTTSFMLVSENPKADSSTCAVFVGNASKALDEKISFIRQGTFNTIYIRAVDKALSKSRFSAAPRIWIKKQSSDVLFINAYNTSKNFVQNFYLQRLAALGVNKVDTMQATEVINSNYTQLQPDVLTQTRTFALFKKIIWVGDDASFTLSLGQRSTASFFDAGGKMFLAVSINSSFDPLSNFLDWTPIRNLVNPPSGSVFRVDNNATVSPVNPNWPRIKSSQIIPSARPFELPEATPTVGFDSLYAGGIIESKAGQSPAPWTGKSTVIAKRWSKSNNQTNFVISSIPLERFNGNNNMDSVFKELFINQLGF